MGDYATARSCRLRRLPRFFLPGAALACFFLLGGSAGCRAILRYPAIGQHAGETVSEDRAMNLVILTSLLDRKLLVEVDWVEGCEPAPIALEALDRIARKYCPKDKLIEIQKDDRIPRDRWLAAIRSREGTTALVREYLGHEPDRSPGTEVIYVLYSPRESESNLGTFGQHEGWTFERDGRIVVVDGLSVFKDAARHRAILWLTADRIDRSTLVHEFGHVLGLVGNPRHEQLNLPGHCSNPDCVMTHPQWRTLLYYALTGFLGAKLPQDYCRDCQADIRGAQRHWEGRAASDPGYADHLRALGEAERLASVSGFLWGKESRAEAIETIRQAIALAPEEESFQSRLGSFLEGDGRLDEAAQAYREALRRNPRSRSAYDLASMLYRQRRYREVIELLASGPPGTEACGVERQHGFLRAWLLSEAHLALDQPDDALRVWEEFLSGSGASSMSRFHARLAMVRIEQTIGRYEQARKILDGMPARFRRMIDWKLARARLALAEHENERARHWLEEVVEEARARMPEYQGRLSGTNLHEDLALALALLTRDSEARELLARLDRMPELDPDSNRLLRARVLAVLGDRRGALDSLEPLAKKPTGWWWDPCRDEELVPLRSDPRFLQMFPDCQPAEGTKASS